MSILLTAYYPEGIVFAADKNATIQYPIRYVSSTATKVLSWPRSRAAVGYVGLGVLADLELDEWMRIFIASTRDFDNIEDLANGLMERVQHDFQRDFPENSDCSRAQLIFHLGGFREIQGIQVPVMYYIHNHTGLNPATGEYGPAVRTFRISDAVRVTYQEAGAPGGYPDGVRTWLETLVNHQSYLWYNNGANLGAFNIFKSVLWQALQEIRRAGFAPAFTGLEAREAFCKMAVQVFGSYYTEHYTPQYRVVGGGVDAVTIPWP